MAFDYFAYGSNMWPPQLRSRCGSAMVVGPARLDGWRLACDKPSDDGSTKLNIRPDAGASVQGLVYRIEDGERQALDAAEPLYTPLIVEVGGRRALTYTYEGEPGDGSPYDWYASTCELGAASHGIEARGIQSQAVPDPIAPGLRPATHDDVALIQDILSEGLAASTDRYYVHPGDYAWWVFHDDPRHPDHFSTWLQGESGFVTIDSLTPHEINVFTRPGVDRMPLVRWSQRRLGMKGEVGWVSDADTELIEDLQGEGYSPVTAYRSYEWDLSKPIPEPNLPSGWEIRAVRDEREANTRRAAAHAAFESTMPDPMHLQRYLDFMRSPVYVPERDLVAVDPTGTVVSFMVWWADPASAKAQIEPFGTHPDFHRRGVGRALIHQALSEMKRAGMEMARVCTGDEMAATAFYEGVGFTDVGRLRWWAPVG
ncbi:MAG TPA: GNAT family N-acetyltransferase [Acidimicrobiia bacterium]|nr:GNAT family N-acetyltransferase [Acidimicrobiia bacterium]